MSQIELTQAKDQLDVLVERATNGEDVVLTRNDRPLVRLVPVQHKRTFGSARGLIQMADDFDAPLEDFDELT